MRLFDVYSVKVVMMMQRRQLFLEISGLNMFDIGDASM
jgi:hypothetical protein